MARQVAILGGIGTGAMVAEAVRDLAAAGHSLHCHGFLDDGESPGTIIAGTPVIGPFESWRSLPEEVVFIGGIHKPKMAQSRFARLMSLGIPDARWTSVIHPSAVLAADARIGLGTYVGPHAVVMAGARVGRHCSLRAGCYVSHDVVLGDFVFVGPNATVSGRARLAEGAHLGPNAAVLEERTVGVNAVVGIGAVVVRNVPDETIVAGNPARPLTSRAGRL